MVYALLVAACCYAISVTVLWRSSAQSVDRLFGKLMRANGQFSACDAELNALKVKYSQALMQIDDKHKDR